MPWFRWLRKRSQDDPTPLEFLALQDGAPVALIGGRMRTIGVPYTLPRDTEDFNRLDFQHFMLRYALKGLYAPPLHHPPSILDVGTGTGRWALDMAQIFPQANVVGLDVNPPPVDEQASAGFDSRPPNYTFVAGNLLEGLPFPDNTFDFVHMRLLFSAIPSDRWVPSMRELARVTRPGGWIESVETTSCQDGGVNTQQLATWIDRLCAGRGVDLSNASRVNTFMREAGLHKISGSIVNLPGGSWGGRIGEMVATDFTGVCRGLGGLIVQSGLATQEQLDGAMVGMREEFKSPNIHCIAPFYVIIGQK